MIRRALPRGWEVVRQPDHGRLAADLHDVLGDRPAGPADGFRLAVAHHDDGWIERDATVRPGPDAGPETFLDLPLDEHLALAAASVRAAGERHPYAGAVVARHVAWLHGARPVPDPAAAARRDAAVASWLETADRQAAAVGVDEPSLAHDQRLCALLDRLSLWLCGWPDGDRLEVERPDGAVVAVVRDAETVRVPAGWLDRSAEVGVAVAHVDVDGDLGPPRRRRWRLVPA